MSRTGARITQADVARAIRAAKQTGAGCVEVLQDGTIRISLSPLSTPKQAPEGIAPENEVVL
jgi:hypothetical protein